VRGIPFTSPRAHFASARLDELRAVGARIALDDFGSGYSSLRYLRNFPIAVLKPDKSCIDDVASGAEDATLARAIIALGRTMNLDIVADGIEDPLQVAELVRLHCRTGQGFSFAKALPADALSRYLNAQRGMRAAKLTILAGEHCTPTRKGRRESSRVAG
jgi:EAL domain-containing protein (putative c-di-GMP-specific phosphodiesterase class I)